MKNSRGDRIRTCGILVTSGTADVVTYTLEELFGTKLRALYQGKKGRDLLDLAVAFARVPSLDAAKIVQCFNHYVASDNATVSRQAYEDNLSAKLDDAAFVGEIEPLLATTAASAWDGDVAWDDAFAFHAKRSRFDVYAAARRLRQALLSHLT